jgi:hypothetical protein
MSAVPVLTKDKLDEVLEESIEEKRQLVLAHHSPCGWRTFKSRFVAGSASSQSVSVEAPRIHDTDASLGLDPGAVLGVSFRLGHKKCIFSTILESIEDHAVDRVARLRWPDRLQYVQRRVFQRTEVPGSLVIAVRFWSEEASPQARIDARTVRHGQIEDVSAGGMRISVAACDGILVGSTYRCAFTLRPGKPPILLDALVRHREVPNHGRASIGFQFVGLEATPQGQRTLDRLAQAVGHFQRARSRGKQ